MTEDTLLLVVSDLALAIQGASRRVCTITLTGTRRGYVVDPTCSV